MLTQRIIKWIGERVKWLTALLVLLILADVFARYLFSTSKAWMNDLEWHVFALIFLLGAAYGFQEDQHVRVDVFYQKWSEKRKAWINLFGNVLLLAPWCLIVIYTAFGYAENAFAIGEGSAEPGGLPGRWIIKSMICVGFALLLIQGIAGSIEHVREIRKRG